MGNLTGYGFQALWKSMLDLYPNGYESSRAQVILLLVSGLIAYCIISIIRSSFSEIKAPFVGYRSNWEPTWLLRLRFIRGSMPIIGEGYKNVSP